MGSRAIPLRFGRGERYAQRAEPTIDAGRFLPRFGPLISVKPYSCFGLLLVFLSPGSRSARNEQYVQRAATHAEWARRSSSCSNRLGPPFICSKGHPQWRNVHTLRCKVATGLSYLTTGGLGRT